MNSVEICRMDRRWEDLRLKDRYQEGVLLHSILGQGIREPLQCVLKAEGLVILLDGFKRLRCALRLGIKLVPVEILAQEEAEGILKLIQVANARSLNILEQASLLEELRTKYSMRASGIAHYLERSQAWVSVRLSMIREMSPTVRQAIFSGRFPARSYMYTLRQFTRVNKIPSCEIDEFVKLVSGKSLSLRKIELLAHGFFRGGDRLREQIRKGNLSWTLRQLARCNLLESPEADVFNEQEKRVLLDLELVQRYMIRVLSEIQDSRLQTPSFLLQAHLLVEGILSRISNFIRTLRRFHDRKPETGSHSSASSPRQIQEGDCPTPRSGSQNGATDPG